MSWGKKKKRKKRDYCDVPACDCDVPGCDCFSLSLLLRTAAVLTRTPAPKGRAERTVTGAIRGYRRVSPKLPTRCRYTPTCSAYALEAIDRHGLGAGLRLAAARLSRCRPGVPFGTSDPVP
ncbi:membrane protein insertion efficiency factor YidD [Actinoplanes sp. GCM10030250]|uniref:membrane protein insertion efficiency factor YidD n=1 Tax=Actinoplanes sp. GCM10030250 TaxID=3273376 RepID=UPI0036148B7E